MTAHPDDPSAGPCTGRSEGRARTRPARLLALALALAAAGCEGVHEAPERRAHEALRARLDAPRAPLPPDAPPEARDTAREAALRGFVRRAPRRPPTVTPGPPVADPLAGDGEITLDFRGADLAAVVDVLIGEGLGETYILDPGVTGTVTLSTNRPLARAEILPVLEEILRLNDAAVVDRGSVLRIVPRAEAGLAPPVITSRTAVARGLTVRVTPLRHVGVNDVAAVLDGFAPETGAIRYDRRQGLVFSIGTAEEQVTIAEVISLLDVDAFAGRSFALRPLEDAEPALVIDELNALFGSPTGAPSRAIRFLPIQRMNAILVITEEQRLLDEALDLIRHLDQGAGEMPALHVYEVRNRRASDLALVLGDIFDADVRGATAGATALPPGAEGREDATAELDGEAAALAATEAAEAAILEPRTGSQPEGRAGVLRITADESSNALVALATGDGAKALEGALRRLDVQPLQVLIEATLVEVALNETLEYGVRWFLESGNFGFSFSDVATTAATAGAGAVLPAGFNAAFRTSDIRVTLSALDSVTDVRVLSSPTLMVLDNEVARLQVGDEVPIVTRSATSVEDPLAPAVQENDFRETGVILEIAPTVNAGGLVVLRVRQEVRQVVDTPGATNPTFSTRTVESTIAVQSGETIALAGLIEESTSGGRDGIPLLSRIPVIGGAFGTTTNSVSRSELIVLIRPVVVRDQAGARAATDELRRQLTALLPPEEVPIR